MLVSSPYRLRVQMRLQLQRTDPRPGQPHYNGMLSAFRTITRQEGLKSLWKVLCLLHQVYYGILHTLR